MSERRFDVDDLTMPMPMPAASPARDAPGAGHPGPGRRQSPHATADSRAVVVHLLVNGRMACGFDSRPPAAWSKGQLWARIENAEMVSCAGCMRAVNELKKK